MARIEWEICLENDEDLYRLKVPGGWLVKTVDIYVDAPVASICFYPDPKHEWKL